MQVPDGANDAFPRMLQTLADLISHQSSAFPEGLGVMPILWLKADQRIPLRRHRDDRELDERTLSQCDEELGALRSVQKQLERRVPTVCRKRNTFAPANALPPELLVTIFTIVTNYEYFQVWSDRETLVLVCHHWNHLINNTPSLWTKIQIRDNIPNASIARALEMSQDSPLEIDNNGGGALERQRVFLSMIFPHAHRWRKVALWVKEAAQALEPMTTLSAPLLESLSLWAMGDPAWARDEPLDIFGGRPPPRLQELSLERIPVPWSPKILCNLKALTITSIGHLGPSLDQLFTILPASPSLELLSIVDVTFSGGASAPIPNPIHMSTLQNLSLSLIPPAIINRILAAIRAPKCKFGWLSPGVPVDPVETLLTPDVSHFFDHFRSGVGAGALVCNIGGVGLYWEGPWNISLDVENIRMARHVLDWMFVSPEPNSPAVPLRLVISWSDPLMVEDIVAVMADTEAVHRVEFDNDAPLAGALGVLATGGLEEGGARTPFPGLKEIFIHKSLDDDEWESLLRMLRGRQGEIEGRDGDYRLSPVSSLEFGEDWYVEDEESFINEFKSTHWPNHVEEVRQLLGHNGKLRWYRWMVAEDGNLELTSRYPGVHD